MDRSRAANDDDDSDEDNRRRRQPKISDKEEEEEEDELAHCTINYVKNTTYKLLIENTDKVWGEATVKDPAPPVPEGREEKAGDFLLIRGKDVKIKKGGTGKDTRVNFEPAQGLLLTEKWEHFDEDMTGKDLVDLKDKCFLLWWQNIEPPKQKTTKQQKTAAKATPAPRKKQKRG